MAGDFIDQQHASIIALGPLKDHVQHLLHHLVDIQGASDRLAYAINDFPTTDSMRAIASFAAVPAERPAIAHGPVPVQTSDESATGRRDRLCVQWPRPAPRHDASPVACWSLRRSWR